jgi:hypothetical protein
MMASFCTNPDTVQYYDEKAGSILKHLKPLFTEHSVDSMPSFGYMLAENDELIVSDRHGMKASMPRNALTIPRLQPFGPKQYYKIKSQLLYDMQHESSGVLMKSLMTVLLSLDTQLFDEDEIMDVLESLVPQSVRPGKYLPMPYTIPEYVDTEDGNPFHDIRPIVYSAAPWLATVTNFGLRRLSAGFAVRPTKYLDSIYNIQFMNQLFSVHYDIDSISGNTLLTMNGTDISHSWQIPVDSISEGKNILNLEPTDKTIENILIGSTAKLFGYRKSENNIRYDIEAFGHNELQIKNPGKNIQIKTKSGKNVPYIAESVGEIGYYYFEYFFRGF